MPCCTRLLIGTVILLTTAFAHGADELTPVKVSPAMANGIFVAVGYGGFRGWSLDGQHWSAQRWSARNEDDNNIIFSLVYRQGIFLASGGGVGHGFILRSIDGKTWNEVVTTKWRIAPLLALDDRFLSVFNDHLQDSVDGVMWTERAPARPVAADGAGGGYFRRWAAGNGAVVFAGDYALPDRKDRVGWLGFSRGGKSEMVLQQAPTDVRGLDFGAGAFVAVTLGGEVLKSVDGSNFKPVFTTGDQHDDNAVRFHQNKFHLQGHKQSFVSDDGEHWVEDKSPPHIPRASSPDGIYADCGWGGITFSIDGRTYQKASVPIDPTGVCAIVYGVVAPTPGDSDAVKAKP